MNKTQNPFIELAKQVGALPTEVKTYRAKIGMKGGGITDMTKLSNKKEKDKIEGVKTADSWCLIPDTSILYDNQK